MKTVIKLDQSITFKIIEQISSKIYTNEKIEIIFYNNFSSPSGISFLSSLINFKQKTNDIKISYDNQESIRYLQKVNFFKNLGINIPENFRRNNTSDNLLECKTISNDNDPDFIDGKLKSILNAHIKNKNNLILGILLTTYEITDNILKHSVGGEFKISDRSIDTPGYISAQYYNSTKNRIEIGISDSGIGIITSMSSAYPQLTPEQILFKAFELNTSRHNILMPTRGNGLAKLKEFVLSSAGSIKCRTGEFLITFNIDNPNGYTIKKPYIQGSHFEIVIGCNNDINTKDIFNAEFEDYEDDIDNFFGTE